MRNVRQAVSRTRNAGVRTQILREAELDPRLRRALLDVAAAQRREFREFGFSMALGDVLTGAHPDCLLVVCRDRTGEPVAFQRYVPCRQEHALSLDAMRRLPRAPGGVHERMIVEVVSWANAHGATDVSLNFAAFRSLFEEDAELEPGQAVEAWLMRRMEGRFGIQMDSLRRFNAKFGPRWVPRYLIYTSPAHLPAIGLAALSAEGFLPFDRGRAAETSATGQTLMCHCPFMGTSNAARRVFPGSFRPRRRR
jgi:lysyl-tRNA synthetase class 2